MNTVEQASPAVLVIEPEPAKRSLPLLTVSEMRSRRRCAREHKIAYRLGYRARKKAGPLRFGSLVHDGLEAWWDTRGVLESALGAVRAGEPDPFDAARAEALLRGYHARWADQNDELEVLAVEVEFECPLINPATGGESRTFRLAGKIDAIVRRRATGEVLIVEHKTAGEDCELGSDYWKRLRLDAQISTYYVGARALGYEPVGCLYDILRKPAQQPKSATPIESRKFTKDGRLYAAQRDTDETPAEFGLRVREELAEHPEKYFVRGIVVRLEDEERDAAYDTWMLARQIREDELARRAPRNPDSCVRFGRTCEFFGVCSGEASLEDETLFRKTDTKHEELAAATPSPTEAA